MRKSLSLLLICLLLGVFSLGACGHRRYYRCHDYDYYRDCDYGDRRSCDDD